MIKLKNLVCFFLFIASLSCSEYRKKQEINEIVDSLKIENETLFNTFNSIDKEEKMIDVDLKNYEKLIEEINTNLITINDKSVKISIISDDKKKIEKMELEILSHLDHIHQLMTNNKHKLAMLHRHLNLLHQKVDKDSNHLVQKIESTIKAMTSEMLTRDVEVGLMNKQLQKINHKFSDMAAIYNQQKSMTDLLASHHNSCYYIIGKFEELLEKNIISPVLMKVKTQEELRYLQATSKYSIFTPIDMTENNHITTTGKKIRILTSQPQDTYKIIGDDFIKGIYIKDKDGFWKDKNYLVVIIE